MRVIVVPPEKGQLGAGTRLLNEHGDEIPGVLTIDVSFKPHDYVTATVKLSARMDQTTAVLLLDRETLERSAAALGLVLTEVSD